MVTVETDVEGEPTHVFTAEHLAPLGLQTGLAKDKARLLRFSEAGALDATDPKPFSPTGALPQLGGVVGAGVCIPREAVNFGSLLKRTAGASHGNGGF